MVWVALWTLPVKAALTGISPARLASDQLQSSARPAHQATLIQEGYNVTSLWIMLQLVGACRSALCSLPCQLLLICFSILRFITGHLRNVEEVLQAELQAGRVMPIADWWSQSSPAFDLCLADNNTKMLA